MPAAETFLLDNGSLQPAATLRLRELAKELAGRMNVPVSSVSLLHSSGVPADQLGGVAAEIFEPAILRRLALGKQEFIVIPLFFGPSGALTDYLPARIAHLRKAHPELKVRLASPLFQAGDDRLARILADKVKESAASIGGKSPLRVALVDHGSPTRAVTDVRDQLATQLGDMLGPGFKVAASSMERRNGVAYDFCEPLLAGLLRQPDWNNGTVIVAMQFLLPGRHAGPEGDVAKICRDAEVASGGALRTRLTGLVGEHSLLVEILTDRWRQARQESDSSVPH
jgi:sirohydrochlorin ferrochelatase